MKLLFYIDQHFLPDLAKVGVFSDVLMHRNTHACIASRLSVPHHVQQRDSQKKAASASCFNEVPLYFQCTAASSLL